MNTTSASTVPRAVWRMRLLAVCLGLAALAFRQKPGLVVADTKLDLTADPGRLLARALHLWDPQGALGQLQNQAYGYLFPMGPFHWALGSVGVPDWVTQRLWWTTLLCVAFLGMWRLSGALRMGSPWARLVGALLFALSPRLLSELTITSVEVWPVAVAPWVLAPLVDQQPRTWQWRVTRSALAVVALGGVNAVASGAALVLPALWFATRRPSRQTAGMAAAWLGACALAMVWWIAPLLVLGRYSPPFLDWIEGAAVTTSTASPFEALRGTTAWLGFLTTPTGPVWPGGWQFATQPLVIVATMGLAAVGVAALAHHRVREWRFLMLSVLVGLILLTLGHSDPLESPVAGAARGLLDGPLAGFRNLHKFDPVVRIPLLLMAGVGLDTVVRAARRLRLHRLVVPVVAGSVVVLVAAPAVGSGLARNEAYAAIPAYWGQTARWLDTQPENGTVLVLPSASFADFSWGSTKDDPLQALMRRPFVVRDAVPLGSAGATRMLDGIGRAVEEGRGSPDLARALATAGIRFVVVRNDLRLDAQAQRLVRVREALEESGLSVSAFFGPTAGFPGESDELTVDYRTLLQRPSVEVYRVPGTTTATMTPVDRIPAVVGGPEDVVEVISATGSGVALYGSDSAAVPGRAARTVLTDGLRRREVNFGESSDNTSQLLARGEPPRQERPVTDYVADPGATPTTRGWTGIKGVSASSSAADANASLRLGAAFGPAAAVDGDASTRWVSGRFKQAVGEWLRVDFEGATHPAGVRVDLSTESPVSAPPTRLRVSTQAGSTTVPVTGGGPVFLTAPPGGTTWLSVALDGVRAGSVPNGFSISELAVDGITARATVDPPAIHTSAGVISLSRDLRGQSGCARADGKSYCQPDTATPAEEASGLSRRVELPEEGQYQVQGSVTPVGGASLDGLFDLPGSIRATASSRLVDSPVDRPGAAVDGDVGTGWVAGADDPTPTLTLTLPERRAVRGLRFERDPSLAASAPGEITVTSDTGRVVRTTVDPEGFARFEPGQATTLTVVFGETRPLRSISSRGGQQTQVPVGTSEVTVLGAADLTKGASLDTSTGVPCGFGPDLVVDGTTHPTKVEGTLGDILAGGSLRWLPCTPDALVLPAGVRTITATRSAEFVPDTLVLRADPTSLAWGSGTNPVAVARSSSEAARVSLPRRESEVVVSLAQNFNAGWSARLNGRTLQPVRVNGWMQGWVVPRGDAVQVLARFEPDRPYRLGLAGGALAMALLLALGFVARRRGRTQAPPAPAEPGVIAQLAVASAALLLWCGWPGLAALGVAVAACAVARRWPNRSGAGPASAVVVLLLVAAGAVALSPWPDGRANVGSLLVQLAVVSALTLAVAAGIGTAGAWPAGRAPRSRRRPQRISGRSMR